MNNHRAIIKLSQQDLERLLRLPPGMHIIGVRDDWASTGVRLLIEGAALEAVDDALEPPVLPGIWHYDPTTGHSRWEGPFAVQDAT